MNFDTQVKLATCEHLAASGQRPSPKEMVQRAGSDAASMAKAYKRRKGNFRDPTAGRF